jgi:hypothetical protein
VYDGPLTPGVAVTGSIGWKTPLDGYDWYCFKVTKGSKVSFAAKRTSGDIKLNLGILSGVGGDNAKVGDLKQITDTSNSTTPDVTLEFTPNFDGDATLWVSTWLGEDGGNYSVTMTGGTAGSTCGAVAGPAGPQIAVTVPQDTILMNDNATITVPVTVSTVSGFANDVTLSVTGLPDDVITSFDKSQFPKPGNGSANLTITTTAQTFPATYFVSVLASGGDQVGGSTFALVVDCSPPVIVGLNQPKNTTVNRGSTTQLSVTADGTGPFVYQWYQGFQGQTSSPVAKGTDSTLTTPAINDTSLFWVRVSNACGSVDSQTATVAAR